MLVLDLLTNTIFMIHKNLYSDFDFPIQEFHSNFSKQFLLFYNSLYLKVTDNVAFGELFSLKIENIKKITII